MQLQDDVVMEGPDVDVEDHIPVQPSEVINNNTSDSLNNAEHEPAHNR